jgi:hypothetical protein
VADRRQQEKKGSGLLILGLGAAAVALLVAYLANCLPGFGRGGGGDSSEGDAKKAPAPAKPADTPTKKEDDAAGASMAIVVEGERCRLDEGAAQDCEAMCHELEPAEARPPHVALDATQGTHRAVESVRRCLREAGYVDVEVVRR